MEKLTDEKVHAEHYDEIRDVFLNEPYAEFLGIQLIDLGPGTASAELFPTKEMLNSHDTVHGGVLFSLADYVFAAASNSYGKTAVGVTTTMNFMAPAFANNKVTAHCREDKRNHRLAWYTIELSSGGDLIGSMQAMVYRKNNYFIKEEQ